MTNLYRGKGIWKVGEVCKEAELSHTYEAAMTNLYLGKDAIATKSHLHIIDPCAKGKNASSSNPYF